MAIAALATFAYRRVGALSGRQRLILTTLRALALAFISLCLLRPMVRVTPADRVGGTVAILIDQSRSMALRDAGGLSRLERAGAISRQLQPLLAARWKVETWLFGDGLHDAHDVALSPTANRSDLATDLSAAVARLAPHGLSGLVVLTDGARTDTADLGALGRQLGVPVVAIGIGRADAADIAIRSVATGESSLDASLVDLVVGLDARGLPKPFNLRLLQNGRVVERRTPHAGQRRRTAARHVHRRSQSRISHGLHARRAGGRWRAHGGQQPRVRPGAAARTGGAAFSCWRGLRASSTRS